MPKVRREWTKRRTKARVRDASPFFACTSVSAVQLLSQSLFGERLLPMTSSLFYERSMVVRWTGAVLQLRGSELRTLSAEERAQIVEKCFEFWRSRGFPYDRLTLREIAGEYASIKQIVTSQLWQRDGLGGSTVGLSLQIASARRCGV